MTKKDFWFKNTGKNLGENVKFYSFLIFAFSYGDAG